MKTFEESAKSKKTVASMIENKEEKKPAKGKENKPVKGNYFANIMDIFTKEVNMKMY